MYRLLTTTRRINKKIVRIGGTVACHPQVERARQQAQKQNLLGFRARAFGISNGFKPGRTALLRRAAKRIKKRAVAAY
jgi:hypothetical protein